jgi:hypothetical protein
MGVQNIRAQSGGVPLMDFQGILFDRPAPLDDEAVEPAHFRDLNLDQVVAAIVGKDPYELRPLFWAPLHDVRTVRYRQDVFRDLECDSLATAVRKFADEMRDAMAQLAAAEKLEHPLLGDRLFLDAAQKYCDSVASLADDLTREVIHSAALLSFRQHIAHYVASPAFAELSAEAAGLEGRLAEVRYSLLIRGRRVTVKRFDPGLDYGTEVTQTFARFNEGGLRDHQVAFRGDLWMGHVQGFVIERLARLFPEEFASVAALRSRHGAYPDATLVAFARNVRFYLAVLEYVHQLKAAGLPFCYPRVSEQAPGMNVKDAFDLALAGKRVTEQRSVVPNDFWLADPERVIIVTGPNQGGKTTFARMCGQLHYLASLGMPIPGTDAELMLPDRVFTLFEREEDVAALRGKLEDDLIRVRAILQEATNRSVVIMNESFSSTTLDDARLLGRRVLEQIIERGSLCVYVTFVDELASLGEATVSMVATVDRDDPALRTFRVVKAPADGRAYAAAIARKYGLSPEQMRGRIGP